MVHSLIVQEREQEFERCILREEEPGLETMFDPVKQYGVRTTKTFERGEFVVEYRGDLMSRKDAEKLYELYSRRNPRKWYMYDFDYNEKKYTVDATKPTNYLGRLINHAATYPNLCGRVFAVNGTPHLILTALRDLGSGSELSYSYCKETDPDIIAAFPWLVDENYNTPAASTHGNCTYTVYST